MEVVCHLRHEVATPPKERLKLRSVISFLIVFLCNRWESGSWIKVLPKIRLEAEDSNYL